MQTDEVKTVLLPPANNSLRFHPQTDGEIIRLGGDTMGTSWLIAMVVDSGFCADQLIRHIEHGFETIIAQMSQWNPESELSRFNGAKPDSWHHISPQFGIVLQSALAIAWSSDGAFDPTFGALSSLWGFGAAGDRGRAPTASEIRSSQKYDWQDVQYEAKIRKLYQPGGLELDLSAIAKGFAVDYIVAVLERVGIAHALVEIGGELRAIGVKPDGQPWWVDLEALPDQEHGPARIALSGWAVATTGHYLRRRSADKSFSILSIIALFPENTARRPHNIDATSRCMPRDLRPSFAPPAGAGLQKPTHAQNPLP